MLMAISSMFSSKNQFTNAMEAFIIFNVAHA